MSSYNKKRSYGTAFAGSRGRAPKRGRAGPIPRTRTGRIQPGTLATRGFSGQYRQLGVSRVAPELKVIDTAEAQYAINTTGSVTLLNGVVTNTDFNTRVGRKIQIKSVQIRGFVSPTNVTGAAPQLARILLVWDTQNNSAAISTMAQILAVSTSTSFLNLDNRDRYKILKEWMMPLGHIINTATQATAGSPTVHRINIYRKMNNETIYSGTTAAITNIATGALLLVTIGSIAAGGTDAIAQLSCRVRFTDA